MPRGQSKPVSEPMSVENDSSGSKNTDYLLLDNQDGFQDATDNSGATCANTSKRANSECRPKLPRPEGPPPACPRCDADPSNTKFCYYNNYNVKQPRFYCKACHRHWTDGGKLRKVVEGAGKRKSRAACKRERGKDSDSKGEGKEGASSGAASSDAGVLDLPDSHKAQRLFADDHTAAAANCSGSQSVTIDDDRLLSMPMHAWPQISDMDCDGPMSKDTVKQQVDALTAAECCGIVEAESIPLDAFCQQESGALTDCATEPRAADLLIDQHHTSDRFDANAYDRPSNFSQKDFGNSHANSVELSAARMLDAGQLSVGGRGVDAPECNRMVHGSPNSNLDTDFFDRVRAGNQHLEEQLRGSLHQQQEERGHDAHRAPLRPQQSHQPYPPQDLRSVGAACGDPGVLYGNMQPQAEPWFLPPYHNAGMWAAQAIVANESMQRQLAMQYDNGRMYSQNAAHDQAHSFQNGYNRFCSQQSAYDMGAHMMRPGDDDAGNCFAAMQQHFSQHQPAELSNASVRQAALELRAEHSGQAAWNEAMQQQSNCVQEQHRRAAAGNLNLNLF